MIEYNYAWHQLLYECIKWYLDSSDRQKQFFRQYIYYCYRHTRPIVSGVWVIIGNSIFLLNIHNALMHCVTSQLEFTPSPSTVIWRPYPEPVYNGCSSAHWDVTWMPLVDPVYIGIPLGDPANIARYTGTSLETLNWNCPTLECHWRMNVCCSLHWNTIGGTITAHTHPGTYN